MAEEAGQRAEAEARARAEEAARAQATAAAEAAAAAMAEEAGQRAEAEARARAEEAARAQATAAAEAAAAAMAAEEAGQRAAAEARARAEEAAAAEAAERSAADAAAAERVAAAEQAASRAEVKAVVGAAAPAPAPAPLDADAALESHSAVMVDGAGLDTVEGLRARLAAVSAEATAFRLKFEELLGDNVRLLGELGAAKAGGSRRGREIPTTPTPTPRSPTPAASYADSSAHWAGRRTKALNLTLEAPVPAPAPPRAVTPPRKSSGPPPPPAPALHSPHASPEDTRRMRSAALLEVLGRSGGAAADDEREREREARVGRPRSPALTRSAPRAPSPRGTPLRAASPKGPALPALDPAATAELKAAVASLLDTLRVLRKREATLHSAISDATGHTPDSLALSVYMTDLAEHASKAVLREDARMIAIFEAAMGVGVEIAAVRKELAGKSELLARTESKKRSARDVWEGLGAASQASRGPGSVLGPPASPAPYWPSRSRAPSPKASRSTSPLLSPLHAVGAALPPLPPPDADPAVWLAWINRYKAGVVGATAEAVPPAQPHVS
jgi:hypothetical protein